MLKKDVFTHFGGAIKTAKALGISKSAVFQWPELVPRGSAYKVQVITSGALQVNPELYPPKRKPGFASNLEVA